MQPDAYSFGLTGYPLEHSLSPRLHHAALKAMGLEGDYKLFPVAPLPDGEVELADLLARLRSGAVQGLNVTIPHKTAIIPFLDELTPAAQTIGAANTLFYQAGRLIGDNTDAPGFMRDLGRFLLAKSEGSAIPHIGPGFQALVLGAGGAGRAVVYALAAAGCPVSVAERRPQLARQLVDYLQHLFQDPPRTIPLEAQEINELRPSLIVNATPVGMWPDVASSPWPEGAAFPAGAFVYDLVYNPSETALTKAARSAGNAATTGLGMLIEQAALSLERWTGLPVPRSAMWEAVL